MCDFLQKKNFDVIENESNDISQLNNEMVEILLNSATYYQKKYTGELEEMNEVFDFHDKNINLFTP